MAVPPSLIGSSASPHRLPGHRQARHELNQVGPGDVPHRAMRVSSAGATRLPSPHRLNFAETFVLTGYGRGRSSSRVRHRSGLLAGSTGGKRRPDPHGQRSLRPSFSTSSVSMPTTRSPRLTLDSLEGTPAAFAGRLKRTPRRHDRGPWPSSLSGGERQDRSGYGRQMPAEIRRPDCPRQAPVVRDMRLQMRTCAPRAAT